MNELFYSYDPLVTGVLESMSQKDLIEERKKILALMSRALKETDVESRELTKKENRRWAELEVEIARIDEHRTGNEPIKPDLEPDTDIQSEAGARYWDISNFMAQRQGMDFEYSRFEKRALQKDLDGSGGVIVPRERLGQIIQERNDILIMRRLANRETAEGTEREAFPKVANRMGVTNWGGELDSGDFDDELSFSKVIFSPHVLPKKCKVSEDLLLLAQSPVEAIVREELTYSAEKACEIAMFSGNGSGKPLGIFVADAQGVPTSRDRNSGHATTLTVNGLIDAVSDMKETWRSGSVWVTSREGERRVRKLADGESRLMWQKGIEGSRPDSLLGFPFYVSEFSPCQTSALWVEDAYVMMLFNPAAYTYCDRVPIRIAVMDQLYRADAQYGYHLRFHTDGHPVSPEGYVRIQLSQ